MSKSQKVQTVLSAQFSGANTVQINFGDEETPSSIAMHQRDLPLGETTKTPVSAEELKGRQFTLDNGIIHFLPKPGTAPHISAKAPAGEGPLPPASSPGAARDPKDYLEAVVKFG